MKNCIVEGMMMEQEMDADIMVACELPIADNGLNDAMWNDVDHSSVRIAGALVSAILI